MPNLLKSLPREILEKEDTKFIYNVLNPLLFEKIRENLDETRKSYQVSEMLDKDIHRYEQFDYDFRLP
jgi:predicted nucleotidyltransferase